MELAVKLAARHAGDGRQLLDRQGFGVVLVHYLDHARKFAVRWWWCIEALDFAPYSRESDDAAAPVPQRYLTEDDHCVGALFRCGAYCIDDGFTGSHHLFILLQVDGHSFIGEELMPELAECFLLRGYAGGGHGPKVVHYHAAFPVLEEERNVLQGIQKGQDLTEVADAVQESLFELARIHAPYIHNKSTSMQAGKPGLWDIADKLKGMDMNDMVSRRQFLEGTMISAVAMAAAGKVAGAAEAAKPEEKKQVEYSRKIKVGLIGGGHRGNLIGGFMRKHGGYEIHAVADYFPEVAEKLGDSFGVDKARRFTGLSGYKKAIESGIEALVIMDVPSFYPEQAKAAVDAGCHVYMAKPFAVDVPGCLLQQTTARQATEKKLCVMVDYQIPKDKANIEVATRIHDGGLEGFSYIYSGGRSGAWSDPPKGPTIENLLRGGVWLSSINLGGDSIVSYDIHIIDGVTWVMGKRPVSACGFSRVARRQPNGDRTDCGSVVFRYEDGTIWTHLSQALANNAETHNLGADFMGIKATATINYWGKAQVHGGPKHFVGKTSGGIYNEGAAANVAEFYRCITEGDFSNPTAQRAVDGTLTAILGREAAARKCLLSMDELIKENKKLEVDLTGLKG